MIGPFRGEDLIRFISRLEVTDSCWLWNAGTSDTGYGTFKAAGMSYSAHRFSYMALVGPIGEGLVIDHLCRVPRCVNPNHLEPVSAGENTRRGRLADVIRDRASSLKECPHGHPKTIENVYRHFNPKRNRWESTCRPCRNARLRKRAAAKRKAAERDG